MRSSSPTGRITPERADSTGNGTRIWVWNGPGWAFLLVMITSQRPLRFNHSFRTICGRGYSGRGLSLDTSAAQRVLSGPCAGYQTAAVSEQAGRRSVKNNNCLRLRKGSWMWSAQSVVRHWGVVNFIVYRFAWCIETEVAKRFRAGKLDFCTC